MAFYLVESKLKDNIVDLRYEIDQGMIHTLIPFGELIDLEFVIQGTLNEHLFCNTKLNLKTILSIIGII
jgi:hypothetical protein